MAEWDKDGPSWQERAEMRMSNTIRCPKCGSDNVECHPKPHFHECYDCGFGHRAAVLTGQEPT